MAAALRGCHSLVLNLRNQTTKGETTMFKFLCALFLAGVLAGIYMFSSDSAKASVKKAGTELVKDAADHATEAALDQTEKAGKKMIARVKDIRKSNTDKLKK
jgi:uncharacterized membrane protein